MTARHVEHQLFPGLVLIALAGLGLWRNWGRDARPLVLSSLALVIAGIVLSFGPEGFRSLYAALHDNIYGFQAMRSPARFAVIAVLGLAVLAALGLRDGVSTRVAAAHHRGPDARIPERRRSRWRSIHPRETPVGQWLKRAPRARCGRASAADH